MRHIYETRSIVLSRTPVGEANMLLTLLTSELGLVRVNAQGVRRSGAKLASSLTTFAESHITLLRGREVWRVSGAILKENWFERMSDIAARRCAVRVCGLLTRLVTGEMPDLTLFSIMVGFFEALTEPTSDAYDSVEVLALLRILAALGLDEHETLEEPSVFVGESLVRVARDRSDYIARINRGIAVSGL